MNCSLPGSSVLSLLHWQAGSLPSATWEAPAEEYALVYIYHVLGRGHGACWLHEALVKPENLILTTPDGAARVQR